MNVKYDPCCFAEVLDHCCCNNISNSSEKCNSPTFPAGTQERVSELRPGGDNNTGHRHRPAGAASVTPGAPTVSA